MASNNSATSGLIVFLIMTLIYFIVRYSLEQGSSDMIYTIIYYLGVLVTQYFINLSAISNKCGTTNYYLAFMVTIVPWVFIFGLLNIMLVAFPGWKAPFSNTFGYLIVSAAGAKNLLIDHILKADFVSRLTKKAKKAKSSDNNDSQYQSHSVAAETAQKGGTQNPEKLAVEAVQHIYSDPSLLLNEVTPDVFDQFWSKMQPLFKDSAGQEEKRELYKFIELKELISEGIWYILTGSLISSVSSNYIMNGDCGIQADEMKKRHKKYEKKMQNDADNPETKKVYEITQ